MCNKYSKVHSTCFHFERVENVGKFSVISLKSVTMIIMSRLDSFKQHNFTMIGFPVICQNWKKKFFYEISPEKF